MEPRIQYCTASDGVKIAYSTLGVGHPLVLMPMMGFNHLELEWQLPEVRGWIERLARDRMVVRYDGRGTGLSDRSALDFAMDAVSTDLAAVVDRIGFDRFALFAVAHSGCPAIAFAAAHPDRVSHLVLWLGYARQADYAGQSQVQTIRSLVDANWEAYTETIGSLQMGWEHGAVAHRWAAFIREVCSPEITKAGHDAMRGYDVTELLPRVDTPTLVLYRRQISWLSVDVAKPLVAGLPNARLVVLEGSSAAYVLDDVESVAATIEEFLEEGEDRYPDGLSSREVEVLRLIAVGRSNREIAELLTISLHTVVRHVSNILAKTGTANRAEAATYAHQHCLIAW